MKYLHQVASVVGLACLLGAWTGESRAEVACPDLSGLQVTPIVEPIKSAEQLAADKLVAEARQSTDVGLSDLTLAKAISQYEEAILIDPQNAPAHLYLAIAHLSSQRYLSVPRKLAHARAWAHLAKGRELDPANVFGLHALADQAFIETNDYECAKHILETGLRLAPNNPRSHRLYAELLSGMGEFELAFEHGDRAVSLAEGDERKSLLLNLGRPRFMAGQYDWVLDHYTSFLKEYPGTGLAHFYRSLAFGAKGQFDEALAEAKLSQPKAPSGDAGGVAMLAMAYAKAGQPETARELLAELLGRDARGEHVVEYRIAAVYEALGEREKALVWLEKEIEDRGVLGSWLLWLNQDPAWTAMREDPRFAKIQQRAGW